MELIEEQIEEQIEEIDEDDFEFLLRIEKEEIIFEEEDYEYEDEEIGIPYHDYEDIIYYDLNPEQFMFQITENIKCYILEGNMKELAKIVYFYHKLGGNMNELLSRLFIIYIETVYFLNPSLTVLIGKFLTNVRDVKPEHIISLSEYIYRSPKSFIMKYMYDSISKNFDSVQSRRRNLNLNPTGENFEINTIEWYYNSFQENIAVHDIISLYYMNIYLKVSGGNINNVYNTLLPFFEDKMTKNEYSVFLNIFNNIQRIERGFTKREKISIGLSLLGTILFGIKCEDCNMSFNNNIEKKWVQYIKEELDPIFIKSVRRREDAFDRYEWDVIYESVVRR